MNDLTPGIILLILLSNACLFCAGKAEAEKDIDLDRWADAIFRAEGGYAAEYLYGIRSVPYKDAAAARRICKNTVYNTLVKYRSARCKVEESDIDCLARRYAPQNADNDPHNLNVSWRNNVLEFYLEGGE
jgi:hypothetical protein